ncbi:hypothetical protein [Pseudomonas sp. M2]|uniref:hypothetical protein n=1 Tax=Pseudomonas sp. M2 TaxID=228756 RepID=UPI0018C90645|nr:hypothetical protein [Pseudomonas sp. M2]MBG6126914.1 hypothetical protein [Pseudomonas sp. M2]HDS1748081.1 hypothetical protein [Pseudomonas putida]
MARNKDAPELTLVKGGAEPVLEALAQRAAKQSGDSPQRLDSTHPPTLGATPYRPTYDDLREAVDEAHAMLSLLATGMRMIASGYGSAQEVRKLADSTAKAAATSQHYLRRLLEGIAAIDGRGA